MPSNSKRIERVNSEILRSVSEILRAGEVISLQGTLISVLNVDTSPDLRNAKVYISIYGADAARRKEIFGTILGAAGKIRSLVGSQMNLRYMPELRFLMDGTMEYSAHISSVLSGLNIKKADDGEEPSGL